MEQLGVQNQVTTFTSSDFGRTLRNNGEGSDHGWGNHQLVMGGSGGASGSVFGQKFYGSFPQLVVEGPDDTGTGRWIPTTAVDQMSSTIARWFGVTETDLTMVFPNLGRFATSDMGFMNLALGAAAPVRPVIRATLTPG
jgi:uncharacterized protein (DUF1501 family)